MNSTTKTLPAELREVPLPEWATGAWDWDEDIDGSWCRSVFRPVLDKAVEIRTLQDWSPGADVTTRDAWIDFQELDTLYSDKDESVWVTARDLAARLLDAVDLLEKAAKR